MKFSLKILAAITLLLALLVLIAPWKGWIEARVKTWMEAQGLQDVQVQIAGLGLHGIRLKDISIGDKTPLVLKELSLDYSLRDLFGRKLQELNLSGLVIDILHKDEEWGVAGFENWRREPDTTPWLLPVTEPQIDRIPFNRVRLKNSLLRISSDLWRVEIPLQADWQKLPEPRMTYAADSLIFKGSNIGIETGAAGFELSPRTQKAWAGAWHIRDVRATGLDTDIPVIHGEGSLTVQPDRIDMEGRFESADQAYKFVFHLNSVLKGQTLLVLKEAAMPWNEGTLEMHDVAIPMGTRQDIKINLEVRRVAVNLLLQKLTGKKATGTGVISGTLPVTVTSDNTILLQDGKLLGDGPGTIALVPDAIPGDNPQVALARDILKNFHYTFLSVDVDRHKDDKISVLMMLEGRNPDVQAGHPVKLNVRLGGDVLNFVQQNILSLTNPRKFLEQSIDAKP